MQLAVGGFDKNFSYVVTDDRTKQCVIVDPAGDADLITYTVDIKHLVPQAVAVTHSHFDHVEKAAMLSKKYAIAVCAHKNAKGRIDLSGGTLHVLKDGEEIKIGDGVMIVLHTPGHIDDAVCYYITAEHAADGRPKLLTGDTLFVQGCGRADLAHSDVKALYESLEKIKKLPEETEIYPGHDYGAQPVSTVGQEKKNNPYLLCENFDDFRAKRLP